MGMGKTEGRAATEVVSASGLGKKYLLPDGFGRRLRHGVRRTLPWALRGKAGKGPEFWALRDVSFSLTKGESLGIIGKNGAGKSTLLQLIAGISAPSAGSVSLAGTVGALLELGTGLYPEYTGRENVFLSGAILGFSRRSILARMDEIRDFAEIGDFFDRPVRTYSSGMFLRLAFSVQICLRPDVFLVDEVLSVGDIFFQQKCHKRLEEMLAAGMSLVFVSHDHGAVQKYSAKTLLLHEGRRLFLGNPAEAVGIYNGLEGRDKAPGEADQGALPGTEKGGVPDGFEAVAGEGRATLLHARITGENGQGPEEGFETGETVRIEYAFRAAGDTEVPVAALQVVNRLNITVHGKSSLHLGAPVPPRVAAGSTVRVRQSLRLGFEPGEYLLGLGLAETSGEIAGKADGLDPAFLESRMRFLLMVRLKKPFVVRPRSAGIKRPFFGIVDLPGECAVEVTGPDGGNPAESDETNV